MVFGFVGNERGREREQVLRRGNDGGASAADG